MKYNCCSVSTCFECGGTVKDSFVANFPESPPVKEFWKFDENWQSYWWSLLYYFFGTMCAITNNTTNKLRCWTCDRKVTGSIPRCATVKWLNFTWTGKQNWCIINTKVNSAFHPSGEGRTSTGLFGKVMVGAITCVEWQVTSHLSWLSLPSIWGR